VNIDQYPSGDSVIVHDLRKGIPLRDQSCDVVYHSSILEHFEQDSALIFLKECFRVLKPDGVIRVAVPDLERMCRLYLRKLGDSINGETNAEFDYDWMMLELYDQSVREKSGGAMGEYLGQEVIPNLDFVKARIGDEARAIIEFARSGRADSGDQRRKRYSLVRRFVSGMLHPRMTFLRFWKRSLVGAVTTTESILTLLTGEDVHPILRIGRFRMSGEVHKWMYDRFSLARLLVQAGFKNPVRLNEGESRIPKWSSYCLDVLPDGTTAKPDSLYMEATRASNS